MSITANKMRVEMRENNSRGIFLLSDDDAVKLLMAGWTVTILYPDRVGDGGKGLHIEIDADSIEHAQEMFERVTGFDRNLCVCACCGQNFYFSEAWD